MKLIPVLLALGALGPFGYAEFIDQPIDTASSSPAANSAAASSTVGQMAAAGQMANLGRHHVSFGPVGYFKSTADVFNADFDHGTEEFLNYRYSFSDHLDLAVDLHAWGQSRNYYGEDVTLTCGGMGLGVRYTAPPVADRIFFYLQGNVLDAVEAVKVGSENSSETGFGFAINGGFELRLGRLISIPVEALYLYGKPSDNISGFGVSAGISINWGKLLAGQASTAGRQSQMRTTIGEPRTASPVPQKTDTSAALKVIPEPAPVIVCPAAAARPLADKRHHVSAGVIGLYRPVSADFKNLGDDAQRGQCRSLNYRYSMGRQFEAVLDGREWVSDFSRRDSSRYTVTVRALGLGARWLPLGNGTRIVPYLQTTVCSVAERVETSNGMDYTKTAARDYGVCLDAGIEIRLSPMIALPLSAMYLFGRPAEDVSGYGIAAGLSCRWGITE